MLDLGGAPSSSSLNDMNGVKAKLNLNKNCHLQAIIFDFCVLTRSISQEAPSTIDQDLQYGSPPASTIRTSATATVPVQPDLDMVNSVANLIKFDWTSNKKDNPIIQQPLNDDLSLILSDATTFTNKDTFNDDNATSKMVRNTTKDDVPPVIQVTPINSGSGSLSNFTSDDIRAKYAARLQKKAPGASISMLDRAKSDHGNDDTEKHMAARAHAMQNGSTSSSRWMLATGTGKLLQYLFHRSMKMGIVASTAASQDLNDKNLFDKEKKEMEDLCQQLKDKIFFASVVKQDGTRTIKQLADQVLKELLQGDKDNHSPIAPDRCMWVSDKDDRLRVAREAGVITVRIVADKNARRGNVSTHYTVRDVSELQQVVNQINGISFNTALQQR